jgi:aromatic-L-amino-acid decarboxylase
LELAAWLGERIQQDQRFTLMAPVNMGLVCFRLASGDEATRRLMHCINETHDFFVSHTALDGRFTIRVAIGNMRTRSDDIEELWRTMCAAADANAGVQSDGR